MRYLRRQTLNRRAAYDNTLYVDTNGSVIMDSRTALKLPNGRGDDMYTSGGFGNPDNERPVIPQNGMMRYNETTFDIEVYQGDTWRALRYREAGEIVQQTLGIGDGDTVYFGPLEPAPPITSQRGYTWTGSNLLVIVENVIQLHTTNYTVVQNPTFSAETYLGKASATVNIGNNIIYLNTSLQTTGSSGTGTTATLTFATQAAPPFSIGEDILITGMAPYAYNGAGTVTACNTSSVSYLSTATSPQTVIGTVTSNNTIYPAVDITGALVTGTLVPPFSHVIDYTTDNTTGALTSITISNNIATAPLAYGTPITIAENTQSGSGYYLHFSSPIPPGKPVTVLHGFDQ